MLLRVALPFIILRDVDCADDKKLTTTLKRIGVTNIPAIEEVNMFKNDGEVIHFVGPKGELHELRVLQGKYSKGQALTILVRGGDRESCMSTTQCR